MSNGSTLLNQLNNIVDKESCGDYLLIDIIGKGGFGVVYKGLHKTKGHFSAIKKIKIIKKKKLQSESQSSLMAEINLLKVLSHHNIVRYYEHIPSTSHSYIVMEFIENGSLEKIIKRHGLLPESLVTVYIAQVLNGLDYLHRQGVIHRDIKAANLLISTDGSIKLADFGVATKVSDLSSDNPDDAFAGTPYWMAPEVIQMQGISTACDVWSLGCTIIELLTGTPPYFGLAPAAALYKIVQEDHPPIPQGISAALKDFLLNCFKKDENIRSSAKQLLHHPWVKSVQIRNPETQVPKNARQEILTYNAQLQDIIQDNSITRPRSSAVVSPPSPQTSTIMHHPIGSSPSTSPSISSPIANAVITGNKPTSVQQPKTTTTTTSWSAVSTASTKSIDKSAINKMNGSNGSLNVVQIASPRKLSAGQKQIVTPTNIAPIPTVPSSVSSSPVIKSQEQLNLEKEKLNSHLSKFSEKETDDDEFGGSNSSSPLLVLPKQQQGLIKPTPPSQLQRQASFNSGNNSQNNSNSNSINSSSKFKLLKFNKFTEKDNEDDESDLIFDQKVSETSRFKVRNQKKEWDDEFDNFGSDDETSDKTTKSSSTTTTPSLSSSGTKRVQIKVMPTNTTLSSPSSNNIKLSPSEMKLKVVEQAEEWDTEIEESFDTISWSETDNQRTINIQDKYREQVVKTIVDFIIQLKPNQPNEVLIDVCQKLTDLFQTYPDERKLLISNGEGGVYFRLPIITILEILEDNTGEIKCGGNGNGSDQSSTSSTTTNSTTNEYGEIINNNSDLIINLLKLLNQSIIKEKDIQETICLMNGISIITRLATRQYNELIREEVSKFVLQLCSYSTYSLNMFITGSRGCKVLVDLLDSDYFNGFTLIHNSLDAISLIFKMNTASPKTALCHLFAKTSLMYRISYLLNQIFNSNDKSSSSSTNQQFQHQQPHTITTSAGTAPIKLKFPQLVKSSSVKNLSKDQFDKVLSYSLKAADILLFFSTGDSLVKEEMSQSSVVKYIVNVMEEIYTWKTIGSNIRSFLLKVLKVIKNLSMDPNIRSRLDDAGVIHPLINYLKKHSGIEKITEIHNQALHSLYYLLLLDRNRQEKALKESILEPLLSIIDERGPLKELALPILFDLVRSCNNRSILWKCNTIDKLLLLIEDRNWFADAIESISTWATLEPTLVFEKLNAGDNTISLQLINILNVNHIKHPSFQKSIIPLFNLLQGSQILLKSLIKEGLVSLLVECLRVDSSPVSKITLLKITASIVQSSPPLLVDINQSRSLYQILNQIFNNQDESEIVKTIAEGLLTSLEQLNK